MHPASSFVNMRRTLTKWKLVHVIQSNRWLLSVSFVVRNLDRSQEFSKWWSNKFCEGIHDIARFDQLNDVFQQARFLSWSSCCLHSVEIPVQQIVYLHLLILDQKIRNKCQFNRLLIDFKRFWRWCFLATCLPESALSRRWNATSIFSLYKKYQRWCENWNQRHF